MSKKEQYLYDLLLRFSEGDREGLKNYLLENSNLPGPRANLELASMFSIFFDDENYMSFENLIYDCLKIDETKLGDDDREVYLIFCALESLGRILGWIENSSKIFKIFEEKSNSKLWRVREACVIGLQDFGEKKPENLGEYLKDLYEKATTYQKRMIFATLAHPPILDKAGLARLSIELSDKTMNEILNMTEEELKKDETKTLLKSMEYVISVFTMFDVDEGFNLMEKYASIDNKYIKKIIKANLEKNRLKKWSDKVEETKKLL